MYHIVAFSKSHINKILNFMYYDKKYSNNIMIEEYTKKLDDKIKELNSTRVFKKITPKYDLSWYIKWSSSIILLLAMALTSVSGFEPLNLILHLIGVTGWLIVGMLWHDRALILLNSIAALIFVTGILIIYYDYS